ncbi:DNA repair protein SWI5 homolog [Uranotaenia lowii]|uniref:DNA repair protein SWI5 homolog n=1 Tax=Uranotaenia lowii TaxID=190385 RepID=UPI0024792D6F|nr:DNA repair protein SWI5 homolog [Uranotaenia lowii]XP_055607982.1 DNA repair protein SWI5 homolog [Uranotaenia lowii]XP_055607983.1 DNA repair protein SWI5 homolog [Uranotaenia lowii]XP_055607984.1 DNA repair protein SWI5 homolog [Uranotaenia lowii]XP_055607985.1 DNA repair protein SWI5 homolog [Uranotaenia lowii]
MSSQKENTPHSKERGKSKKQAGDETEKLLMMDLLHKYNDIKDATQKVLGALAVLEGVTVKEMHEKYNLPLDS